ncbi:exostosin family protein [Striga asiatica]|uniref:Exostosin family protein n=1 Tax=Striga asiatica TaxID=4170 RepID=A0A5A7R9A9_STRAF|nr:exostosin family protein [Striga asiatica]
MWKPKRLNNWFSYFSISPKILVLLLLTPLLLISFISSNLGSQKSLLSSFSLKPLEFLSPFSLCSFANVNGSVCLSKNAQDKEALLRQELSSAEIRGFVSSGIRRKYSRREKTEALLAKSRFLIREAAKNKSLSSSQVEQYPDDVPHGPIYRNANAFYRSYLEMERVFKIYVYEEGEAPVFHDGPCRSIYSTEGRFIHEIEKGEHYRTYDPNEAHVFFMPFSVVVMVRYIYESGSPDMTPVANTVADYVDTIAHRHPFWNRTLGADHFMLSCHDWGPYSSSYSPFLFNNSIRVLCNANTSEGFNPLKDVTLPEINLKTGEITGLLGGAPPRERTILAFFAGGLHGHIRHLLLNHWKGKNDSDVQVYEKLPTEVSYESMLKKSKFCLCPSGYEVASPRVVEAIYAECVPVLISDSYVPPFSDVLNWRKFSVFVRVEDIPKIKRILMGISEAKYLKMQRRVKEVQRHFVVNGPTKRFDLFHMIVHSVWLRRLNLRFHGL